MREQESSIGRLEFSPEVYAGLTIWGQFRENEVVASDRDYSEREIMRFSAIRDPTVLDTLEILGYLKSCLEDGDGKMYFPADDETIEYAEEILNYIEEEYWNNNEGFVEMFDDWDRRELHSRFEEI